MLISTFGESTLSLSRLVRLDFHYPLELLGINMYMHLNFKTYTYQKCQILVLTFNYFYFLLMECDASPFQGVLNLDQYNKKPSKEDELCSNQYLYLLSKR
jgi:hypothetical protein